MLNQHFSLVSVTTVAAEPVATTDLKQHERITTADDDTLIAGLVKAARKMVEKDTHRQLFKVQKQMRLDCFPRGGTIYFPTAPLSSDTSDVSIAYIDATGSSTTLASTDYIVDPFSEPARVTPAYNTDWPTIRDQINAVTLTYTCGYGTDSTSVPQPLRQAILMLAGHWYEHREAFIDGTLPKRIELGYEALVSSYRYGTLH